MTDVFQIWASLVSSLGLHPFWTSVLVLIPAGCAMVAWVVYTKKLWIFKNIDKSASYRRFAIDWEEFKNTRRYELEQIVRSNTVALINSLIYPYIREQYLYKLGDDVKSARHCAVQPTMVVLKYRINEIFYQAIKENGFQEIIEAGQRSTYCWKKAGQIVEAIEDIMCRFMSDEEIIDLKVFNSDMAYCKAFTQHIYEALDRDYDQARPAETGIITQIMQHNARTKIKALELNSDPFCVYNNMPKGGA